MNYSVLPPEVLSGQVYSGPGPVPLLAAAQSWAALAEELSSASTAFSSIISQLEASSWQGSASAAMIAAAGPYAGWLGAAASEAARAAAQAEAAAGLHDAARASVAHPAAVASNRAQLLALARSNLLGLNAPAIAAAETAYEEMWAKDVAAMAAYHGGASTVAAQLSSWQRPPGSPSGQGSSSSAAAGVAAPNAVSLLQFAENEVQNLEQRITALQQRATAVTVTDMFELQRLFNRRAQLLEMTVQKDISRLAP